jgi:hypothetical protein
MLRNVGCSLCCPPVASNFSEAHKTHSLGDLPSIRKGFTHAISLTFLAALYVKAVVEKDLEASAPNYEPPTWLPQRVPRRTKSPTFRERRPCQRDIVLQTLALSRPSGWRLTPRIWRLRRTRELHSSFTGAQSQA